MTSTKVWRCLWFAVGCVVLSPAGVADPLPGTAALEMQGDIADQLLAGVDAFLNQATAASAKNRARHWRRDVSSREAYEKSIAPNRDRFRRLIGAVDERVPEVQLQLLATTERGALLARGTGYEVFAVRWPVLPGVDGEGLLLEPVDKQPVAQCIALPDADQTPEQVVGIAPGIPAASQYARRLAESGCRVVVPVLINRDDTFSIVAGGERPTNQPHREFIYRQAFEMGRHVIGYEVQKVLALADWMHARRGPMAARIGVYGYGEGGLIALYSAAADTRIDVTAVAGYFTDRSGVWREPIYRNVWRLLDEFGDAEIASLVAPRELIVIDCPGPEIAGPPPERQGRKGAAPGALSAEIAGADEAARVFDQLSAGSGDVFLTIGKGLWFLTTLEVATAGAPEAVEMFLEELAPDAALAADGAWSPVAGTAVDPVARQKRQFDQLVEFTQRLVRQSDQTRSRFWSQADRASRDRDKWQTSTRWYRDYFYDETIGRIRQPLLPANVRTRRIYDEPRYTGYEVVMDVFPEVIGYGILLVPKNIPAGQRRPVVVCQHGLEGRPQDLTEPGSDNRFYHRFAGRLAEEGYVTYSPQNLYIFKERFRAVQRKANPLGLSMFSFIVPQHQQAVDWLGSLPMVDKERIAFYGLSYGGKTAMRVPPLVDGYCLSICSGDFNEWIWKNTSIDYRGSYMGTGEYEIFEWDLGNTFNYTEMAGLIAPRPFMVERGHRDGVAPDEWVAYEFAKTRLLYADLNIEDRVEIEFFEGPHTIHGQGTFAFLRKHLGKPE